MSEIKNVSSDISRGAALDILNENDKILDGKIRQQEFNKLEIDQLYADLTIARKYIRNLQLGHTLETYNSWAETFVEAGYSIWKFPISNYVGNCFNQLLFDDKFIDYRGIASSEQLTQFNAVLSVLDGATTDLTAEAGTIGGTAFCFLENTDGATTFFYLGSDEKFSSVDFELEQIGSGYNIGLEIFDGSSWYAWDGSCQLSNWKDDTDDMQYNGRISWDLPLSWELSQIDGATNYWARILTRYYPTTVATLYHLLPGDSVRTLLSLSELQYINKEYAWCYYNGNVYLTLVNTGDAYYEGDYFIKGTSSQVLKLNYFIYNHEIKMNHQSESYTAPIVGLLLPTWIDSGRPSDPAIGTIGFNTQRGQIEIFTGITDENISGWEMK